MVNLKKHALLALIYFLVIALLGVLLRFFYVTNIPVNYRYIVHTHSHVALLGWVYTALTTLIYKLYLTEKPIAGKYKILFACTQITIIGMLITFPVQGYALFSIIFSTLFLIVSYWFVWFLAKHTTPEQKQTCSYQCTHAALWYMILSSIGPWALGAIMNTLGSTSIWYRNAIYFYLHFQYNGWFTLSLFGFLFYVFEQHKIKYPEKSFRLFFVLFNVGIVFTFFLSVLWIQPHGFFYIIAGIGVLLQGVAFGWLIKEVFSFRSHLKTILSREVVLLLQTAVLLFSVKIVMQLLGSIPYIADLISLNIDFVIGYLHWTFLGIISLALFAFLCHFKLFHFHKRAYFLYLIGFILTEGLVFYKGIVVWLGYSLMKNYFTVLAIVSIIFLVAIVDILIAQFQKPMIDPNNSKANAEVNASR